VKSSEVSLAWAHQGERAKVRRWPRDRTRVATVKNSKVSLAWAHLWIRVERAKAGVGIDDNYRGGDDNYPRLVVKMGPWDERKDVAGTGRNSCR
jgi:hypothetical protein